VPNFLGIGASRSGTTWLYANLRRHPDIWLPPIKELHYFDRRHVPRRENQYYREQLRKRSRRYRRLKTYRTALKRRDAALLRDLRWDLYFFARRRTNRWYTGLFRPGQGQIAGEITPAYAFLKPDVVEEIQGINPDLKVIYLLRDPIDRSWSSAVKELRRGNERSVSDIPDEAFFKHFNRAGHERRRDYVRTLNTWEGVFGRERMFVGFLDDIEQDPRELLQRLYGFLGVPGNRAKIPARFLKKRVNASQERRSAIPPRFEAFLADLYLPQLQELSGRFGEPVTGWLRRAEEALAVAAGR
jgi:hypothetical protein